MLSEELEALSIAIGGAKLVESRLPHKVAGGERLGIDDGVGKLYARGPLFKKKSWLTDAFGYATYEQLSRDLQVALDKKEVESILIYVDSPGGEASGCDELAEAIFAARKVKPVAAYVSGMACSAAFWLASAAGKITASESSIIGSVGVILSVEDRTKADAMRGVKTVQFVSSQSPGKRPDLNSDTGRARLQKMVDDLADVFVAAVAKHRNITAADVAKWSGGVEIGRRAQAAGMIDAIGLVEDAERGLRKAPIPISTKLPAKPVATAHRIVVSPPPLAPQLSVAERARVEAAAKAEAAELARIREIFRTIASAETASYYAYDTRMSAAEARADLERKAIEKGWQLAAQNANRAFFGDS
ncbi:S49 family peptidase [Rhizobium sp. LjRoot30]|uniref:S49 family peptidase n=1 Tax=Rhizobium sp. LjRoot30 TaxID=3342320 RepID=UPI003ECD8431